MNRVRWRYVSGRWEVASEIQWYKNVDSRCRRYLVGLRSCRHPNKNTQEILKEENSVSVCTIVYDLDHDTRVAQEPNDQSSSFPHRVMDT